MEKEKTKEGRRTTEINEGINVGKGKVRQGKVRKAKIRKGKVRQGNVK